MLKLFRRNPSGPVTFEQQLSTLEGCGIKLAPGVAPEAMLGSIGREAFEAEPYRLLLICMGGEAENEAQAGETGHPSDNIWHFDTECIEDQGAYVTIARRLSELAQGALPLEDVTDHIDIDAGEAHVAFRLAGQDYHWEATVDNDWVDASILSRFASLLERSGQGRRFTYIDLSGQDCLIGCAVESERARLAKETGLKVEWLK